MAAHQHGVIELPQLLRLGLTTRAVQYRATAGRLFRIHRGVFALVPPALLSYRGRLLAAVLACGDGAALSHRSAADLHGLRRTVSARIEVVLPGRSIRKAAGVTVHRSTTLTTADVTRVDAIPCTTVARTLLDLAGVVPAAQVERALNQAEMLRVFDYTAITEQITRNRQTRAATALGAGLAIYRPGDAPTESQLEEALVELVRAAGLPEPERQVHLELGDGEPGIRADFVWRAQRLVLETDGVESHGTQRSLQDDRRRDQRLTLAGWRVVRVTWRQITDSPATVVALLAGLLEQL